VRRETGKDWTVKVRRDEGIANRRGPESCVGIREGCGEASTGECTGQPLSRERSKTPGADAVQTAEGNTCGRASANNPSADRITMPPRELFSSAEDFYATLNHESAHAVGSPKRLN